MSAFDKKGALIFVIAFGVVSLFADMTYEGMRAISGPFLASLGADGWVGADADGTPQLRARFHARARRL